MWFCLVCYGGQERGARRVGAWTAPPARARPHLHTCKPAKCSALVCIWRCHPPAGAGAAGAGGEAPHGGQAPGQRAAGRSRLSRESCVPAPCTAGARARGLIACIIWLALPPAASHPGAPAGSHSLPRPLSFFPMFSEQPRQHQHPPPDSLRAPRPGQRRAADGGCGWAWGVGRRRAWEMHCARRPGPCSCASVADTRTDPARPLPWRRTAVPPRTAAPRGWSS